MPELRGERMQAVSRLVLHGERAIEPVVHDVHSGERELRADLVGHAGEDRHLEERPFFVLLEGPADWTEVRHCVERPEPALLLLAQSRAADVDHAAEGERRVVHEVVLESAAYGDRPFDEREVGLLHRLLGELRPQGVERGGGAGDEDESRGVRVDPVERPRHEGSVPKRDALRVARGDAVHERPGLCAGERLHGHAGGLVEREQVVVLEKRAQTDRGVRRDCVVACFRE